MAERKTEGKAKSPAGAAAAAKPAGGAKRKAEAAPAAQHAAPRTRKAKAAEGGKTVKVRLVRSGIGTPKDQRATLRGLGLTRIRQERELKDSPALRGMMFKVRHLISVDGEPAA